MSFSFINDRNKFINEFYIKYNNYFIFIFILLTFYTFIFSHALYTTLSQIFYITVFFLIITKKIQIKDIIDSTSILICVFFVIGTISNLHNNRSLEMACRILTWFFPYLLAKLTIRYQKITPEKFLYTLCIFVFLFAIVGVIGDLLSINEIFGKKIYYGNRFAFTMRNSNTAGFYLSGSLLSLLAIYITDKKNSILKNIIIYCIPILILFYALILTAEKKSLYLLPFFIIAFVVISKKYKILASLIAVLLLTISITSLPDRLAVSNLSMHSSTVSSRVNAWQISYHLIKQKPMIGHGYASFTDASKNYFEQHKEKFSFKKYYPLYGAHNIILNTLAETGIFGLLCIISIFIVTFSNVFKKIDADNFILFIGLILIFIVLKSFFGSNYLPPQKF